MTKCVPRFRTLTTFLLFVALIVLALPSWAVTAKQVSQLQRLAARGNAQAFQQLHQAAQHGSRPAEFALGTLYENGQGVLRDYSKAVYWWSKASAQKKRTAKPVANYDTRRAINREIGRQWIQEAIMSTPGGAQAWAKSVSLWEKAAALGDVKAEKRLALAYDDGLGVPQSYAKGAYWYQKAAAQGDVNAENSLGDAYAHGQGVPKNYVKAAYWYEQAARGDATAVGKSFAEYSLGSLYYHGKGVPQSYAEAAYWWEIVAAEGGFSADGSLGALFVDRQNYTQAAHWFRGVAGLAGNFLGGARPDPRALQQLQRAAQQGDPTAEFDFGVLLFNHDNKPFGLPHGSDYARAVPWYKKAAIQGDVDAEDTLGSYYHLGLGVRKNSAKALYWWKRAAAQGDADSEYAVGAQYQHGSGVPQNYAKAIYWYQLAAAHGEPGAERQAEALRRKTRRAP